MKPQTYNPKGRKPSQNFILFCLCFEYRLRVRDGALVVSVRGIHVSVGIESTIGMKDCIMRHVKRLQVRCAIHGKWAHRLLKIWHADSLQIRVVLQSGAALIRRTRALQRIKIDFRKSGVVVEKRPERNFLQCIEISYESERIPGDTMGTV